MKCRMEGLDDISRLFDGLMSDTDKATTEALNKGGLILQRHTKSAVEKAANKGYATGALARSIIPTKPKTNDRGKFVVVRPVGTDSKGVRNGEKWGYLLHGNGRPGSKKHDFKTEAIRAAQKECREVAEETLQKYLARR